MGNGVRVKEGMGSIGLGLWREKRYRGRGEEWRWVRVNETPLGYVLIWITDTSRCSIAASTCNAHVYHSCHIVHTQPTNYLIWYYKMSDVSTCCIDCREWSGWRGKGCLPTKPMPIMINSFPAEINEVIYFRVVELNITYILDIMWFARDYRLNCARFELRSSL